MVTVPPQGGSQVFDSPCAPVVAGSTVTRNSELGTTELGTRELGTRELGTRNTGTRTT